VSWENVFQKQYEAELGEKGKKEVNSQEQVSQVSLFPDRKI
jgi:hypothetical protein